MLDRLKVAELREVAREFGVDESGSKTKKELIAQMAEEGVTEEMYANFVNAEKVDPDIEERVADAKPTEAEDELLLKMTRENPTYEILGYRFTKEHPYISVPVSDAQTILDNETGFMQASPREVEEYYS